VSVFLGVDGGGSKTRFLLVDDAGRVLASHAEGPAYYLEVGFDALTDMLARGTEQTFKQANLATSALTFAFLGLPAYGEDSALLSVLDAAPAGALPAGRYRCGNDMVCGWAGALAGSDGINVVAGTGSIAYGEYRGRRARAGGWGELFSDEGSAYWLAQEGLRLFSRMSDGRSPRTPLYERVRRHFSLNDDLDLCARIYGKSVAQRSQFAHLARLVAESATAGDAAARALFERAASELADLVHAVRDQLNVAPEAELPASCSGGLFDLRDLLRAPFEAALARGARRYRFLAPRLPPDVGAALHAAKLCGMPLAAASVAALEAACQRQPLERYPGGTA
jgi:N-acetylglucosamine kinase-like BadF-type ATPase